MTLAALRAMAEGWQWVHRSRTDELNGVWTFVRDRTPEQVIAAFSMKPSLARSLTWEESIQNYPEGEAVRFGAFGGWTFALEDMTNIGSDVVGALSTGTRAACVLWTAKPNHWLTYHEDGQLVVGFEPWMDWSLYGTDPGRFARHLRELVFIPRPDDWESEIYDEAPSNVVCMLAFLTAIAGIRLPREVAHGPLLTCATWQEVPWDEM